MFKNLLNVSVVVFLLVLVGTSAKAQGTRAQAQARSQAEAKAREEARELDREKARAQAQAQRNAPAPNFQSFEKYVKERLDKKTAALLEELRGENPTVYEHIITGMYLHMQSLTNTKVTAERHLYSFFVVGKFTAEDKTLIYHKSFAKMSNNVKMIISPGGIFVFVISNKSFVDDGDEEYTFGRVELRMPKGHEPFTIVIPHLWYFKNIAIHTEKKKLPMSNIGELKLIKSESLESVVSGTTD